MPTHNHDASFRAELVNSAPKTAAAIRALNLQIGMTFKTAMPPDQFTKIFAREAELIRAAAHESSAIRKLRSETTPANAPSPFPAYRPPRRP